MSDPKPIPLEQGTERFYVPYFEVRIGNNPLPAEVVRDVMSVTYKDSVEEIDSFEMTVNNWDAQKRRLRYEPPSDVTLDEMFDPGKRLELHMGYLNNTRLMLTGEITALEPIYPETGTPTLTVRGLNLLHSFRTEQHTYSWDKKKPSEIAQWIGKQKRQTDKPGLGIPVEINDTAAGTEQPLEYTFMNNQYDVVFLLQLARQHGYELLLRETKTGNKVEQKLYFGPSDVSRQTPTYQLEWGKSLISFRPTLNTARQISEVVVRGWNRATNRPIEEKFGIANLEPKRGPEHDRRTQIAQAFGNRKLIITDRPVHTPAEAKKMAKDLFERQYKQMVTGSASVIGLPDIRAGRAVEIVGLGDRFSGMYYITKTTHTIGENGYRTQFDCRREDKK